MKTENGFVLLENKEDVKKWLSKQKVTRKITIYKYINLYNIRK